MPEYVSGDSPLLRGRIPRKFKRGIDTKYEVKLAGIRKRRLAAGIFYKMWVYTLI